MTGALFQLKTHSAFNVAMGTTVINGIITIILFIMFSILRKKKTIRDSRIVREYRNIFYLQLFFWVFAVTIPLSYVIPDVRVADYNMRIHVSIALFAIYNYIKLIFNYSREEDKPGVKIFTRVFLIYSFVFLAVAFSTRWLISGYKGMDANGWIFEYGPLFNFGFGIPFFVIVIYGIVKMIQSRRLFTSNPLEKIRYTLILTGLILMILGGAFQVVAVFADMVLSQFDMAVVGVSVLSTFIGLASIIQFYQIQVTNRHSESSLISTLEKLQAAIISGRNSLEMLTPSTQKLTTLTLEINEVVNMSRNRTQSAQTSAQHQKDTIRNFSTMVISNLTTFEQILTSMNEQGNRIEEFKEIIQGINRLLQDIAEKGKIVSGGVVSLNSVINDAKVHAENNYTLINEVRNAIQKIVMVTEAIDRVSEDSNVLSMNAAIESATSGKIGQGFQVVSNDLRNMSIKTKGETDKIKDIIHMLQSDLDKGFVSAMKVRDFFSELEKTIEKIFNFIMTIIQSTNDLITKITHVEHTIETLLGIARSSLERGEEMQKLNNELNESILSLKYMIESIRRAMNETLQIMEVVFSFSAFLQTQTDAYQLQANQLQALFQDIDESIKKEGALNQDSST